MTDYKDCNNCQHEDRNLSDYPCNGCDSYINQYWTPKPTPPKPKGIDIVMTCGEEHHIDTEQPEIASVKVNGEQVYPLTDKCCKEEPEDTRLPAKGDYYPLHDLITALSEKNKESHWSDWVISYDVARDPARTSYVMTIDFKGSSLPKALFKI